MKEALVTLIVLAIGVLIGAAVLAPQGWVAVTVIAFGVYRASRFNAEVRNAVHSGRKAMRNRAEYRTHD